LLNRIFFFLADEPVDVSASRLVCQSFNRLASPYLIRRVVLAPRVEALIRLREICNHEYFRHQLTELIWDASRFDKVSDWVE